MVVQVILLDVSGFGLLTMNVTRFAGVLSLCA